MQKSSLIVRGLRTNIQEWGCSSNPTLIFIHGWMDCGASFKFLAPYLADDYHIVAPDLRGFGETDHADAYWFPDYFADLDVILDKYAPSGPASLVGHSMGGNIAAMYAGICPDRVNRLLILETLGLAQTEPAQAPQKYRQWLSQVNSSESSRVYPNRGALMHSIARGNPNLSNEIVAELSQLWGKPYNDEGAMQLKHDHKHRYVNPVRYNFDDVLAVWREVQAKVGLILANESHLYRQYQQSDRIEVAMQALNIAEQDYSLLSGCGHMLHLEKPKETAHLIGSFMRI